MKKRPASTWVFILISLLTAGWFLASCNKHTSPPPPMTVPGKMEGKWTINTVTTVARDSTGASIPGDSVIYSQPGGEYWQFNGDGSWKEVLFNDSTGIEQGNYTTPSDSLFVLTNTDLPGYTEPCTIWVLTANHFVFSHEGPPFADKHYVHYTFDLTR